jgi:hypothetical protein
MGYAEQFWMAQDAAFLQKTKMAMVKVSNDVNAEEPATPYHDQRVAYGTLCLRQLDTGGDETQKIAYSIALDPLGVGINVESADSVYYNAVSAVWGAHAGVVTIA